jgi:hypothetical protein
VKDSSSSGVSFFGLLFIAFLVLKLCAVIDWSWWWITAPLWGPLVFAVVCVIGAYLFQKWLFR